MKASTQTMSVTDAIPIAEKSVVSLLSELFKLRLTTLVLLTTYVGYYLGSSEPISYLRLLHTMLGTALLAAGASALNQLFEREHDARMPRTASRPLPSGQMTAESVLIIGGLCVGAGMIWLALKVNILTALLGAATVASYVLVYTPLKRVTTLNTAIGAIPGALPPLMGWTAAHGEISTAGWTLFAILFFWQLPHFLAIAWMYREEYSEAGFVMLPSVDPTGERTSRQAFCHVMGLLPVSLAPFLLGMVGTVYLAGALVLGIFFLTCGFQFMRRPTKVRAKGLFYASITYLPLLLALMVFDKVKRL